MQNVRCAAASLLMFVYLGVSFCAVCCAANNNELGVATTQLRCEYAANALGIDVARPRFSWKLSSSQRNRVQSAYQILVASSEERLAANVGDKWDSGKVVSEQSVHLVYDGKELGSGEMCWWKARCWDQDGRSLGYSGPATFQMGLLAPGDWQGEWIAADPSISSPLLRKEFQITSPVKRATCYISGLGYYELSINGRRVSDHVLDPGNTYYHNDQPLQLGSRVLYVTHDVTDHLKTGANAVGVMLGHGWYSAEDDIAPSPSFREPYSDRPILLLQLNIELESGERLSVVSDGSWRTSAGPVTYNDYCNGESYDARRERPGWNAPRLVGSNGVGSNGVGSDGVGSDWDDSDWHPAQSVSAPSGQLDAQIMPAIKVVQTIKPVRLLQPKQGVFIFDFGQNFSGWTRLRVRGSQGTKVTIRHGARLYADGSLDNRSSAYSCPDNDEDYVAGRPGNDQRYHHCARQTDTYICRGAGTEIWEPRFTLHGFRYAEVTGFPGAPTLSDLEGRFVRSDVDTVGKFTCSNPLINQIHSNVCWTLMSSLQSFPQDAADRSERVGWLGDPIPEDYILNYDTALFWSKWLDDLKDSQKPNGDVPVISPLHWRRTFDPYYMSPCWKSTYPIVVWDVYQHYADKRVLERHYRGIEKLVAFLGTQATEHIISAGLGDHMEPQPDGTSSAGPVHTPISLTSTAYYYRDIWILAQAARILGKTDDTAKYDRLAEEVRSAFHRKFFDSDSRSYGTGSQTSNAVPLYFDMVPEEQTEAVLENLVGDILHKHQGHLSTGMLGTNALAQTLARLGRADVMYEIATKTTFPSWGYQVKHGATTLWEAWEASTEPQLSDNMKLFATVDKFFYKDLAGIRLTAPGFKTIAIRPQIVGDLTHARASVDTIRGKFASSWQRDKGSLSLDVSIPANCRAEVSVPTLGGPGPMIQESGKTVWRGAKFVPGAPGIGNGQRQRDYVTFDVGSGVYSFQLRAETPVPPASRRD